VRGFRHAEKKVALVCLRFLERCWNLRHTTGAIVVRGFRHAEKKVALVWRLYSAAAIRPARLSCVAFATRRSDPCQDSQ